MKLRTLAASAAVLLALTGCVRLTSETTFHEDQTVSQHAVLAAEPSALATLEDQLAMLPEGSLPEDAAPDDVLPSLTMLLDADALREQLAGLDEETAGTLEIEDYSDESGREGVEITATDIPLEELTSLAGVGTLGTGAPLVEYEDGIYTVTVDAGMGEALAGAGGGMQGLGLAEAAIDFALTYTFPGPVTEASVGTVSGNSVTLGLQDVLDSDEIRIVAGGEAQIDWGPWLRWGLVGLGATVLVVGATLLVLQDRRRRHATTPPPPREGEPQGPGILPQQGPGPSD